MTLDIHANRWPWQAVCHPAARADVTAADCCCLLMELLFAVTKTAVAITWTIALQSNCVAALREEP
jgi:hypothetical protein